MAKVQANSRNRLVYAPVLSAHDPAVRASSFRKRFEPAQVKSQAERQARTQLAAESEAPVLAAPAPLVTSPEIDRIEKRHERIAYQGLAPVMRKVAWT
jgi:hypothetical protein